MTASIPTRGQDHPVPQAPPAARATTAAAEAKAYAVEALQQRSLFFSVPWHYRVREMGTCALVGALGGLGRPLRDAISKSMWSSRPFVGGMVWGATLGGVCQSAVWASDFADGSAGRANYLSPFFVALVTPFFSKEAFPSMKPSVRVIAPIVLFTCALRLGYTVMETQDQTHDTGSDTGNTRDSK